MIRYMASMGQCSDPSAPGFDPMGIRLVPGLIEVITSETTAPGQRHAALAGHEGAIALRGWLGQPSDPRSQKLGVDWILGIAWRPYQRDDFVTPPFPGYISGHSTFSRSAAEVLAAITGDEFFPGGYAEFVAKKNEYLVHEQGPTQTVRLRWATYFDAADQAGISRLYGGIHPRTDDFTGRRVGSTVGRGAYALAKTYFEGSARP